jgi:hypothetical protein
MLARKVLQTKTVIIFAALSVAAGCGQNANIAQKGTLPSNQAGMTGTQSPERLDMSKPQAPAPIPAPAPAQVDTDKKPDPAIQAQAQDDDKDGKNKKSQAVAQVTCGEGTVLKDGKCEAAPKKVDLGQQAACPAPAPAPAPVVINGKNGENGKDGPQGPKGDPACGVANGSSFTAPNLNTDFARYKDEELPYLSSDRHHLDKLMVGDVNRFDKDGEKLFQGEKYVQDAMVAFHFRLALPPRDAIKHFDLNSSIIRMTDVQRVQDWEFKDTEILCFMQEKVCSGALFGPNENGWDKNINHAFFGHGGKVYNRAFVDQYTFTERRNIEFPWESKKLHRKMLYKAKLSVQPNFELKLADLLKGSAYGGGEKQMLDFLYGKADPKKPLERDLEIVMADDTMIKSATIELHYDEDTCVSRPFEVAAPAPAQAPAQTQAQQPVPSQVQQPAPAAQPEAAKPVRSKHTKPKRTKSRYPKKPGSR